MSFIARRKPNLRILAGIGLASIAALGIASCASPSSNSPMPPASTAPSGLSYSAPTSTYTVGAGITNNVPTVGGGAVASYSVTPDLPAGLSLNTSTGVISGTPTATSAATSYTVTASNGAGNTTASVSITISPMSVTTALGPTANPSIAIIGGGAANKLWIVDGQYHRVITSIWSDGNNQTNVNLPRATGAHQWNYPDLHDTHAIVVRHDFSKLYTLNWFSYTDTSYAIEFDPKTLQETRRVGTGKGSHHAALSPDDHYLYVGNQYETFVSVIDTSTMTKVTDIQVGGMNVYASPTTYWDGIPINTKYMYVTVGGAPPVDNNTPAPAGSVPVNGVAVISMDANTLVTTIPIGTPVHAVNITPDGKEVWVSQPAGQAKTGAGTGDLTVIDPTTLTIKQRLTLGAGSVHIIFDRTNKYAFVTGGGKLFKIDRSNYSVVWSVPTTSGAHLGVSPDNTEVWTLDHSFNKTRYPYLVGGLNPTGIEVFSTDDGHVITEMVTEAVSHEIQFVPVSALGSPTSSGTGSSGQAVYTANCQVCHGEGGAGQSDGGPALNTGTWKNNAAGVQTYITAGAPAAGMPAFGNILSAADLAAVSAYIAGL